VQASTLKQLGRSFQAGHERRKAALSVEEADWQRNLRSLAEHAPLQRQIKRLSCIADDAPLPSLCRPEGLTVTTSIIRGCPVLSSIAPVNIDLLIKEPDAIVELTGENNGNDGNNRNGGGNRNSAKAQALKTKKAVKRTQRKKTSKTKRTKATSGKSAQLFSAAREPSHARTAS
jgi:hypothetical protein